MWCGNEQSLNNSEWSYLGCIYWQTRVGVGFWRMNKLLLTDRIMSKKTIWQKAEKGEITLQIQEMMTSPIW